MSWLAAFIADCMAVSPDSAEYIPMVLTATPPRGRSQCLAHDMGDGPCAVCVLAVADGRRLTQQGECVPGDGQPAGEDLAVGPADLLDLAEQLAQLQPLVGEHGRPLDGCGCGQLGQGDVG